MFLTHPTLTENDLGRIQTAIDTVFSRAAR